MRSRQRPSTRDLVEQVWALALAAAMCTKVLARPFLPARDLGLGVSSVCD